ncbi:hypothetical protein SXCC_03629 [Gluconacetobacter sp. SXCC-1]|nr:hypothetical protein SXCC_03629 [Gluconacetobacter sp. SXCC-1]
MKGQAHEKKIYDARILFPVGVNNIPARHRGEGYGRPDLKNYYRT